SWLGTPHRLGGMNRRGIDCSGLVVVLYDDLFDRRLPRTTRGLMRTGRPVGRNDLSGGDLVFFKPAGKSHHVGVYLGGGEFVHTSTTYGVTISRMDDDFWRRCYLTGRRLL
ncbi:MAG TPA: NlpC/P60 family protein, partial [Desulfosarcina sp.]|nr:NlpC/P60 family protein [Desulfosarcina sp.]